MSEFLEEVRAYVKQNIIGREKEFDALREDPTVVYKDFQRRGLSNWWIQPRYGGRGISLVDSVDIIAEVAYGDAGLAFSFFAPILSSHPVEVFGSEQQREQYLRPMATTGAWGATMASERASGSELLRMTTVSRQEGDSYVISGEKYFSTNASMAEFFVIHTRLQAEAPEFRSFVVAANTPGIRMVQRWPLIGLHASATYEIALEDCRIPASAALAGNGLRVLESSLNASRTLMSAIAVGVARRMRDVCLEYARDKRVGEHALINNDVFAAKMAQMEVEIDTMVQVCKAAALEWDSIRADANATEQFTRRGVLKSVVTAKLMCAQLGWKIAGVASELFGSLGYTEHHIIGKLVRDIRHVAIVEAGEDVLRAMMYSRYVMPAATRRWLA